MKTERISSGPKIVKKLLENVIYYCQEKTASSPGKTEEVALGIKLSLQQ